MSVATEREFYRTNKKEYLGHLSKETNYKFSHAEFYESANSFKVLEDQLEDYFKEGSHNYFPGLSVEKLIMRSIIENPERTVLKVHDSITLVLPCGSHIRLSPYKNDSMEITRVLVTSEMREQGIGSILMNLLFDFIMDTLGFIPEMYLECTGSVGFNPENSSKISIQTAFFRKHGFRVDNGKHHPRYVSMKRPKQIKTNNIP